MYSNLFNVLIYLACVLPSAAALTSADLVARRREYLTAGDALNALASQSPQPSYYPSLQQKAQTISTSAASLISSIDTSSTRTSLWSDISLSVLDATTRSGNLGVHFDRLLSIAVAYGTPGTAQYQNAQVATTITDSLEFLCTKYYNGGAIYGNWWFWEIGIPRSAGDTLAIMGSAVPDAAVQKVTTAERAYAPNPLRRGKNAASGMLETGANLVDKALNTCVRGLLVNNGTEVAICRDALSGGGNAAASVFNYVTSGDGFYRDGSYVQHSYMPYTGTYGVVALSGLGQVLTLLSGSDWAVTDPAQSMVYDIVDNTFSPYMINGRIMDTVRGRAVSRQHDQDYFDGFSVLAAVAQLSDAAPSDKASHFKGWVKGHAQRYTGPDWAATPDFSLASTVRVLSVVGDSSVAAEGPLSTTLFHAGHERLVHRTPTWSFTVSTSSTRIGRFEWGNRENIRGWYQGDGVSFLYSQNQDGQFSDDFWPTVDSQALPGITATSVVMTGSANAGTGIPRAPNNYNGGLSLGSSGTVAMDLQGYVTSGAPTLKALKSWYVFDEGVVCVGTNIADTSGTGVVTLMENRAYDTLPAVKVNGSSVITPGYSAQGWNGAMHVDGVGAYVLLKPEGGPPTTGRVWSRPFSGSWKDVNQGTDTGGSADVKTKQYLRLDVLHGTNPTNGQYAYMIIPGADSGGATNRPSAPGYRVVTTDGVAHFVQRNGNSNASFAHFFAAGSVANTTSTAPASVGWKKEKGTITVAVSDPTRLTSSATITFPFSVSAVNAADGVTVVSMSPLQITAALAGTRGAALTFTATAA